MLNPLSQYLDIHPEVMEALRSKKPVVALESTVISHGLPYPDNLNTTATMMQAIRQENAVPAIIALLDGKIKIGLTPEELHFLATNKNILKVSRCDISYCLTTKEPGATTVAGTMICAHLANIKIFATGGLGGVHRGVENTFDISSDLLEFSKTPILVVCSGVKSILDVPKTLEYLETQGVPIIGYKTKDFPLFFSSASAFKLFHSMENTIDIAQLALIQWKLGLGGLVVANPIPIEDEIPLKDIEKLVNGAVEECLKNNIVGKQVTPFILKRLTELSHGTTMKANISLLINNARIAGKIAQNIY